MIMRLHILAQNGIDHGLVAFPLLLEEFEYIGIYTQSDLFLLLRPADLGIFKEVVAKGRDVGIIDLFVLHLCYPLPISARRP